MVPNLFGTFQDDWLPYFETRVVEEGAPGWPSVIVSIWERNSIGERRFVRSLTYNPPEPDCVLAARFVGGGETIEVTGRGYTDDEARGDLNRQLIGRFRGGVTYEVSAGSIGLGSIYVAEGTPWITPAKDGRHGVATE